MQRSASMTPRTVDAFLAFSYAQNLFQMQYNKAQHAAKEILLQKCVCLYLPRTNIKSMAMSSGFSTVCNEECVRLKRSHYHTFRWNLTQESPSVEINGGQMCWPQYCASYFRIIYQARSEKWIWSYVGRKFELDIKVNDGGLIHTAVSQTTLLIKERVKQFGGLVGENITK